jgi:uncharacterized protein YndB with AHSA1/START domain
VDKPGGNKLIRVEVDTMIERPIEKVFDRLINISSYSKWLPKSRVFLDSKQTSPGPVGVGTTFVDKTRVGTYRGEVVAFQRPTQVSFRMRLAWFGIKVMESRPEYNLEPLAGGTKVHHLAVGTLYGPFKLMRPYVTLRARAERKRTIVMLKKSLEL